jgi:hypothetical protein
VTDVDPTPPEDREIFGPAEFARRIRMSEDWVRRNSKRLPRIPYGRRLHFDQACVDAWVEANRVDPLRVQRTERSRRKNR